MRKETREVYVCEHCGKLCRTAAACVNHKKTCRKAPNYLLACSDCANLKMGLWKARDIRLEKDGVERGA